MAKRTAFAAKVAAGLLLRRMRLLVDEAGRLREERNAFGHAYEATRAGLYALMARLGENVPVIGATYAAVLRRQGERVVDAAKFRALVGDAEFMRLVSVPVGVAEAVLSKEQLASVVGWREDARPTLLVHSLAGGARKTNAPEMEGAKGANV